MIPHRGFFCPSLRTGHASCPCIRLSMRKFLLACSHCRAYPVVPVHQTIQVGKPVGWMRVGGFCQGLLLLGHHRLAHTSALRLSLHTDQHCSSLPSFALWLAFPTADYYEGSAPYPALV